MTTIKHKDKFPDGALEYADGRTIKVGYKDALKLLPCPFCGGKANILNWQAYCLKCGAATGLHDTPQLCAKAWNKRK